MNYSGLGRNEQNVLFPLCWQGAIGTIPRLAVRGRVMRIMRGRTRIRTTAVGGGYIGDAYAYSTAGYFALSSCFSQPAKYEAEGLYC